MPGAVPAQNGIRSAVMRCLYALVCWLAAVVPAFALPSPAQRVTTADGLPSNVVHEIVEDRQGYLWFATADGLARHDGSGFRVWRMEEGLADNEVLSMALDAQDQLWIGTGNGHLQRMSADRQQLARWAGPGTGTAAASPVLAVQPLADGSVWFGTREAGVFRLGREGRLRQYLPAADGRGLPSARVEWLAADPGGGVWIGSAAGLARWQGDRFQPPTLLGATTLPVTALGLDAEGAVWSSTADGTQVRRLPGLQPANGEGNPGRRWLGHSRGGGQWFSDSGQVWWQDSTGQNARVVALPAVAGRTLPRIARVVEDRYGRVWLLGSHQGVWRLGAQWRHTERFKATGGAAGEAAGALAPAADGNAWYVRGGWLTKVSPTRGFDSHRWSYAHDPQRADRHVVVEGRHGQVWVFAAPWLTRLDPLRGRSERWRLPDAEGAEGAEGVATAHAVLRICGDQLWLAGQGHLQQRTTQGVELGTWSYDAARLRPGAAPFALACGAAGQAWLWDREGLKQWRPDDAWFAPVPQAPRRQIGVLHLATDGQLWMADAEGWAAYRHDAGRLRRVVRFDAAHGLPAVMPRGLAEAHGALWATSARGVVRLQPQQRDVRLYTADDGLPMMVFDHGLIAAGRHLLAIDVDGDVMAWDPAGMAGATVPATVVIDRVKVRRQGRWIELPAADPLRFNADDRDIQLSARLLNGSHGGVSDYRFRLRGKDPEWVRAGERGTRGFPRLPAGEHVLEYQARGADGRWSPLQSTRLQVAYSGWSHPGAWALLLLGGAGALTLILWRARRRYARHTARQRAEAGQRRAEQAAEAKAHYLATLGHEIRTPLTGVLGMSELLLIAPLAPRERVQVLRIQEGGRTLLEVIDTALDTARLQAGKLPLQPRRVHMAAWLSSVQAALVDPLADRGCALALCRQLPASACIEADPDRLRHVLDSLLWTLVTHTGAVRIGVRAASLPGRAGLLLDVIATPGACPSPALSTLREALADTDALVHAQHGRLHLLQRADGTWQGSLSLALPWQQDQPDTPDAPLAAGALHVLLVEDDPLVAEVVSGLLRVHGHTVTHAGHALSALAQLAGGGAQVILLDLDLPGMDGMSLLRLIRQQGHRQPALVVTARRDPDLVAQVTLAGADGLLHKPVAGEALQAAMRRMRPG